MRRCFPYKFSQVESTERLANPIKAMSCPNSMPSRNRKPSRDGFRTRCPSTVTDQFAVPLVVMRAWSFPSGEQIVHSDFRSAISCVEHPPPITVAKHIVKNCNQRFIESFRFQAL